MAENAEQEVGLAKQEVGLYLPNGASQSETDENFGLLGYLYSILIPNKAESAEQEVQELGLYIGNGASQSETD